MKIRRGRPDAGRGEPSGIDGLGVADAIPFLLRKKRAGCDEPNTGHHVNDNKLEYSQSCDDLDEESYSGRGGISAGIALLGAIAALAAIAVWLLLR